MSVASSKVPPRACLGFTGVATVVDTVHAGVALVYPRHYRGTGVAPAGVLRPRPTRGRLAHGFRTQERRLRLRTSHRLSPKREGTLQIVPKHWHSGTGTLALSISVSNAIQVTRCKSNLRLRRRRSGPKEPTPRTVTPANELTRSVQQTVTDLVPSSHLTSPHLSLSLLSRVREPVVQRTPCAG